MSAARSTGSKTTRTKPKKSSLGRGLGNLLDNSGETKKEKQQAGIVDVQVSEIRANPDNPRKKFEKTAIEELAVTIKKHGLLQPILLKKENDYYQIISGERRLRAVRHLKLKTIPAIVKEIDDQEILEVSMIENIQREQLDPIEEALVYQKLIQDYNLKQEEVAQRVGKNRTTIANRIRLLQLPENLQTALADGRVTEGQVRPLLGLSETIQGRLSRELLTHQYTARQIEDMVQNYKAKPGTSAKSGKSSKVSANVKALGRELEELLDTRVQLSFNENKKSGKLTIEYFSLDDLDRILKKLGLKNHDLK